MSKKNRNQGPALAASPQLTGRTAVQESPAPAQNAEDLSDSWSVQNMLHLAKEIKSEIDSQVESMLYIRQHFGADHHSTIARLNLHVDLLNLKEIIVDWRSDCYSSDYPDDSSLLAAIRGHLNEAASQRDAALAARAAAKIFAAHKAKSAA